MPTVLVLDVSLSMTRLVANRLVPEDQQTTFHALAVQGINQFLDYLTVTSKLEYVALCSEYMQKANPIQFIWNNLAYRPLWTPQNDKTRLSDS